MPLAGQALVCVCLHVCVWRVFIHFWRSCRLTDKWKKAVLIKRLKFLSRLLLLLLLFLWNTLTDIKWANRKEGDKAKKCQSTERDQQLLSAGKVSVCPKVGKHISTQKYIQVNRRGRLLSMFVCDCVFKRRMK